MFKVLVKGEVANISVDRLKPAFTEATAAESEAGTSRQEGNDQEPTTPQSTDVKVYPGKQVRFATQQQPRYLGGSVVATDFYI